MVNTSKYTAWCCGCGQIWEEDNATDRDTKYNNHKDCSLVKEMNAYFSANADKAHEIKMLLTWFNSFKTLKEHLKNDDDISKINRTGFYHDSSGWQNEYKDWFVELRKREKPTSEKCADCQQEKQNLVSITENNKTIKVCSECKQKRDSQGKKCEICNSSTEVEKTAAPPRIQKGSFFDKIVSQENRQECCLCKNCITTGKGNEPLEEEETTAGKCEKCSKNPQSGKVGKNGWNFCAECLKHPTAKGDEDFNKDSVKCLECRKILVWACLNGDGLCCPWGYNEKYKWEWEDKTAVQRWKKIKEKIPPSNGYFGDEYCSDECQSKNEAKQEEQRPFCIRCKKNKICRQNPELCSQCLEKPYDNNEDAPNEYPCERCQTSTYNKEKNSYIRRRITHYYTDFTKKVWYFGMNCPCAEQFKKEHEQSCSHCNKTEWPDMKKGWMLDYEIKKAFCSPDCHVKYRNLSWEQADQLNQIEMFSPELDVPSNNNSNFNWEQEGLRREVLYWRESVRELKRQLEESKKKSPSQRHPNEIPHQARQISYLLRLHQNTQQKAENAYKSKFGELKEDGSNNENKGMSGGMIALLVVGGITLVGVIIFLLTRIKKKK